MSDDSGHDGTDRARNFGRRNLLRAVGLGAALSGAGVVGAQTTGTPSEGTAGDETATPGAGGGGAGGGGEDASSAFGFPALSGDVQPPTEADHTVELYIRPREGSEIPEFFFEPTGLAIEPGDTVKFDYVTPHHTVTAYHPAFGYRPRVPEGVPPFSAPVLPAGGYWLYTFEHEGVYDYHCGPHEVFGHVGRIVAGSAKGFEPLPDLCAEQGGASETETASGGETGTETPAMETPASAETATPSGGGEGGEGGGGGGGGEEARLPFLTAHTVLSDPALDPENILSQGSVSWDELDPKSKRLFVSIEGFPPCGDGC